MGIKLDLKDKKILQELDLDSRHSNSQIARKVHISKDAVGYRIKNLEKKKIILGYYSLLNISKMGYVAYKLMLTFQNTTSNVEKEIVNYLQKSSYVGWLVSCDGHYNLMAIAWVKNAIVFDKFFTEFLKKYSRYLKERDIIIITEIHASRKSYLFDKSKDENPDTFYGGEPEIALNKKEFLLIRKLANNARTPLHKIAESMNMTGEGVAHNIKKLRKRGIIQAFRPIINTSLLGYQYYNVLFRLNNFENIEKIFGYFKSQPNIIYFVKYLGSYDLGIDIEVKNTEGLRKIMKEIKDHFSRYIESYKSVLIYQEHKLSYLPETN